MSENMMCSDHKSSNDKYREGYDRIFRNGKDKNVEEKDDRN